MPASFARLPDWMLGNSWHQNNERGMHKESAQQCIKRTSIINPQLKKMYPKFPTSTFSSVCCSLDIKKKSSEQGLNR